MKAVGIQPDAISYNTAISVSGEAGRWRDGLALLEEMPGEGIKPDHTTYSTAILLCGRCGQLEAGLGKQRGGGAVVCLPHAFFLRWFFFPLHVPSLYVGCTWRRLGKQGGRCCCHTLFFVDRFFPRRVLVLSCLSRYLVLRGWVSREALLLPYDFFLGGFVPPWCACIIVLGGAG